MYKMKKIILLGIILIFLLGIIIYFIVKGSGNNTNPGTQCTSSDCNNHGIPSGTKPDCKCACTDGWGGDNCQTPPPTPTPSGSSTCFRGKGESGIDISKQKDIASSFWKYQWDPIIQGNGVLQIVNGGAEPMWIRYKSAPDSKQCKLPNDGDQCQPKNVYYVLGINPGDGMDWEPFITKASLLNGNIAHKWNAENTNGMTGQGDGFKLNPGEYQIVPYSGSAAWFAGALGCCTNGDQCIINPMGRGMQPVTLFEWTNAQYGVWDASMVDGFQLPMKIEVDGVPDGIDPITYLETDQKLCPNKQLDSNGNYVGCKSMCACQNDGQPDSDCPGMTLLKDMPSFSDSPVNEEGMAAGYCGCGLNGCSPWLNELFKQDPAGIAYCDAVTAIAKNSKGLRSVYCQAYDDAAGLRSSGNGIVKVTICNSGFEFAKDMPSTCSGGGGGVKTCKELGIDATPCGSQEYACEPKGGGTPGCSNEQMQCSGTLCHNV